MTDSNADSDPVSVGDCVIDIEDATDSPDVGIVILTPNIPIRDWVVNEDTGETVADQNPNYSPSEQVVLLSFVESALNERFPEWRSHHPDLYEAVIENSVAFHAFPQSRLLEAPPDLAADALSA